MKCTIFLKYFADKIGNSPFGCLVEINGSYNFPGSANLKMRLLWACCALVAVTEAVSFFDLVVEEWNLFKVRNV